MDQDIDRTIISFARAQKIDAAGVFEDIEETQKLIKVIAKQQTAKPSGFRELADICSTLSKGSEVKSTKDFAKRIRDQERGILQK